MKFPLYISNMS